MIALLLLLAMLPAAAPEVSARGLVELTTDGEVLFLPQHKRQPFEGWLYTHSQDSCAVIADAMVDVTHYPRLFPNVKSVTLISRVGATVTYEMELTVILSPTIHGSITRVGPRTLRYNDPDTKAYSVYDLSDDDDGTCAVRYQVVEEAGKSVGWVDIIKSLESTAGDAGNFAVAISSARGFSKPEARQQRVRTHHADEALALLAGKGTAISIDRRDPKPTYTLRRRVKTPFSEVAWAIRNKKGYAEKMPSMKKAVDRGKSVAYTIGGFGGRVSFETAVSEEVDGSGVLTIHETVNGGDLSAKDGSWRWRVVPVSGGVDVELVFKADFVAGSRLLSAMAETDPVTRESFMLYVALSLMSDVVGGKSLPVTAPTLAGSAVGPAIPVIAATVQ